MTKSMSQRAYAAHRRELGLPGHTHEAVRKAIACGRIVPGPDGKIDPEIADKQWAERTRPRLAMEKPNGSAPSYAAARAEREWFEAKLAELDYKQRVGDLMDASEMEDAAFKAGRLARDRMLTIPDRVADVLAGVTSAARVHSLLADEIGIALDHLAERPRKRGA